jgi:hypothetical protein
MVIAKELPAMQLQSVLDLKQEVFERLKKEGERSVAATESLVDPRPEGRLAVGYSERSNKDYRLEIRVQSQKGKAYRRAQEISDKAKGEANIEIIPRIETPARREIEPVQTKRKTT